jgi:hypothetical protein
MESTGHLHVMRPSVAAALTQGSAAAPTLASLVEGLGEDAILQAVRQYISQSSAEKYVHARLDLLHTHTPMHEVYMDDQPFQLRWFLRVCAPCVRQG